MNNNKVSDILLRELSIHDEAVLREIRDIQTEHQIANELLKKGNRDACNGFLMSAYTEAEFEEFLEYGGTITIAEVMPKHQTIGYLLANPGSIIRDKYPNTKIHWKSSLVQKQYKIDYDAGRFLYLDQIGVTYKFLGTGVAQSLLERLEQKAKGQIILAAVLQEPLNNLRSHKFFCRNGYADVGHFFTEELKGLINVKSTVFLKKIKTTYGT